MNLLINWRFSAVLVSLLLGATGCTQVDAGNLGVVTKWGEIQDIALQEGIHFRTPVKTQIINISTRVHKMEASASAAGAANAMDVALRLDRHVEVDDVRNLRDIDTARGDIRGNQYPGITGLECFEGSLSGVLRLVTMNGFGRDAGSHQLLRHPVGAVLRPGEDDGPADLRAKEELFQHGRLVCVVDHRLELLDLLDRHLLRSHLDPHRLAQNLIGKRVLDFRLEQSGKRPGTIFRVMAVLGHPPACFGGQGYFCFFSSKLFVDLLDEFINDQLHDFHTQRIEGYDAVFGSRFIKGGKAINYPLMKKKLNRFFNTMIRLFFRIKYKK